MSDGQIAAEERAHASDTSAQVVGDVEGWLPLKQRITLGLQQVLVSNAWLDPIFIASAAGFSAILAKNLVSATFLAAGIVTFLQSTKLVRLPIVQGSSSAFSPLAIGYYKSNSLPAASLGLLLGAGVVFLLALTGALSQVRRLLSPAVSGTIIALVGFALANFTFQQFFGGPGSPTYLTTTSLLLGCLTTATVVICTALGGRLRMFGFVAALIVGDAFAFAAGYIDFSNVADTAWLALPHLLPYGPLSFDLGITLTMCIVFFVAVVEAMGMYEATADLTQSSLSDQRFNRGIAGEAGGSMIAALFGGFGTTAYAQNLGVIKLTGIANRHVIKVAGLIFIAFAFMPKISAILVATPASVIGGLFLPAAATVILTGIQHASTERGSPIKNLVAPFGLMAGLGVPPLAASFEGVAPSLISELSSHSIVVGAIVVFVSEILLVHTGSFLNKKS